MESSNNRHLMIGVTGAVTAYLIWGLQPIYWKMLAVVDASAVIAHRFCWTAVFLILFIALSGQINALRETAIQIARSKRALFLLLLISLMGFLNWCINIYAPISGHVIELGIGLFLTPIMSVILGVFFFRESLTPTQKVSVLLALVGIFIMLFNFGQFPWIALGVSSTWAIYGALKKKVQLQPTIAIFFETAIVVPFACVFLIASGEADVFFGLLTENRELSLALIGTGILTSLPLIAYTYATNYLPLSLLGFCQFLSPILTLCLGIFVYKEAFHLSELVPLLFIWLSIVVFFFDQVRRVRIAKKIYLSATPKRVL